MWWVSGSLICVVVSMVIVYVGTNPVLETSVRRKVSLIGGVAMTIAFLELGISLYFLGGK